MSNFIVSESTIHYVAAFLERWQEKSPTSHHHVEAQKELRDLSNYLLEHLKAPCTVGIIRHYKK